MKNFRGFASGLVLGLSIAFAGVAFAQSATPTDPNQKSESCCCMSSFCCGDSCSMKKDGAASNGAPKADKHECCCGDSCSMKKDSAMKEGAKKSDGHGCCCCDGESCNMKDINHMKTKDMKDSKSKP